MPDDEAPEFVSVAWIAKRWSVGEGAVRELIKTGALPAHQVTPGLLRVRRHDVEAHEATSIKETTSA